VTISSGSGLLGVEVFVWVGNLVGVIVDSSAKVGVVVGNGGRGVKDAVGSGVENGVDNIEGTAGWENHVQARVVKITSMPTFFVVWILDKIILLLGECAEILRNHILSFLIGEIFLYKWKINHLQVSFSI